MGVKLSEWKLKITGGDAISTVIGKMASLADKAAGGMGALQERVDKFAAGVKNAASEVPGLNRVLELVTNPYIAVTAGVVALGAGLVSSTNMALDFEKGLAQANTTARLSPKALGELRTELINMGSNSTTPLEKIPGAFNQIISAVGDTDKALAIMGPALKGAQAGFTDITTVSEALVNVMGAVGNATPTAVLDTLFATVRVGKGEFADFANYLPKIIPLANNVGIGYQQVAGAFALMTTKGQSAEQSAMLLQNAMVSLSKSEVIYGGKSTAGFIKSGIAIFDHHQKMRSLVDIVGDLSKKTAGMTDQQKQAFLAGLGLDAQASAAFSVMAQYSGQLRESVAAVTKSAGEMDAALALSGNRSDRIALAWNRLKGAMLNIGYGLLPYVDAGLDLLSRGFTWVEQNMNTLQAVVTGVGAGIGVVLASMAASVIWTGAAWVASMVSSLGATFLLQYGILALRTAIFSIPIVGWAALAITALVTLYQKSSEFRAVLAGVASVLISLWDPIKLLGAAIANLFNPAAFAANMAAFVSSVRNLNVGQSFSEGYGNSLLESAKAEGSQNKTALGSLTGKAPAAPLGGSSAGKLKDGIKGVNESGRSVRNVVVTIGALMRDTKIIMGDSHKGKSDSELEDFIKETLIRAVSGAEQALAS